jgi:hypothetical protein
MASSLFYIGEIGFNDYSFALMNNVNDTVGLAESLVPDIIAVIRSALIVSNRASQLISPAVFSIAYISLYPERD